MSGKRRRQGNTSVATPTPAAHHRRWVDRCHPRGAGCRHAAGLCRSRPLRLRAAGRSAIHLREPARVGGPDLESVSWAFTAVHAGYWIPLTWLSYMPARSCSASIPAQNTSSICCSISRTRCCCLRCCGEPRRRLAAARRGRAVCAAPLHVESWPGSPSARTSSARCSGCSLRTHMSATPHGRATAPVLLAVGRPVHPWVNGETHGGNLPHPSS